MSEFEKEAEAATAILLAMSEDYNPDVQIDTEEAKEDPVATEGNVNIKKILSGIQTSTKLADEVNTASLNKLNSWVKTVFSIGYKTKELLISFKSDATEVITDYDDKYKTFKSTINDAYRKIEGNVARGLENIGLKEQLDNIMLQHEKMLFIALQLCYSKIEQGDLLEPTSEDIPGKVDKILTTSEHKEQLMIHVNKLFETFYYGKLGVSAVNSYNIVESDGIAGFFKRSNKDLIDNYNTNEIRKTIDSFVNIDETKLIAQQSKFPVFASGGISSVKEIEALANLYSDGIEGVILGKAIYEGQIDLSEAIDLAKRII